MELRVIARAYNGYTEKFGIPRQSGCAASVLTRIVFEREFRHAESLRGIEEWSHLWLLWGFSANEGWSPTVRPPRLGGNKRIGVFATRSPFRPNSIGLSSVRLEKVEKTREEGLVLVVSGADLMNGTPIYDIKPYLPYTDIHTDATNGFAGENTDYRLEVKWAKGTKKGVPASVIKELNEILAEDPRPAYQHDERLYAFCFAGYTVQFRVAEKLLTVHHLTQEEKSQEP